MSRGLRTWILLLVVAAAFAWGVIRLFHFQFETGEVYPEYSSLRADPMGARLLYESLAQLPGVTVERNYTPLEFLPREGATVVLLAMNPWQVIGDAQGLLKPVERIATRGNRVVLTMDFNESLREEFGKSSRRQSEKDSKPKKPATTAPLEELWKVQCAVDADPKQSHPIYFAHAEGWRELDRAGGRALAIERAFGKGSVVLVAESGDFSNRAAARLTRLRLVSEILGPGRRVIFDEQHLGIRESGSVVAMARQFRLLGFALGLGICAALFLWRNATGFPPSPPARAREHYSGRTSHAGLLTLLKRHIPPAELAAVCWSEWWSANRNQVSARRRERVETILRTAAGRPAEAAREIQTVLEAKGEL